MGRGIGLFVALAVMVGGGCGGARRSEPLPSFSIATAHGELDERITFVATSTRDVGPVTITLLDHHRAPVASVTQELHGTPSRPGSALFVFDRYDVRDPSIAHLGVEGIDVSFGGAHFVDHHVAQYELEAGATRRWWVGAGAAPQLAVEDDFAGAPSTLQLSFMQRQ
ncbi:MAG: hypothetical protein JST00_43045 [Deltaproteobacteria bacterium]|nr:hypothetical protein [Deltaproteobacteria bacterium]